MSAEHLNFGSLLDLAELAMHFGKVERITYHPDRTTRETDSTHTVMLIWVACSLASQISPRLDLGLVAQFAAVHDAPEALKGDCQTLRISDAEREAKDNAERHATKELERRFLGSLPWLPFYLTLYQRQDTPEARFVRIVDKMLPGLTHLLNDGLVFLQMGITREELSAFAAKQQAEFEGRVSPGAEALLREIHRRILNLVQ